ncbi:MAG: hypothetical protein H6Q00_2156 [Holophagaceae bacterium]|nr:hypothetical protein [Holophagaceae bacterium]
MAFLEVHANPNPRTQATIPLLLDVQADLLSSLGTRVVLPLYRRDAAPGRLMTRLTPSLEFQGECYVLMTPELAGVPRQALGPTLGSLASARAEILAALDLLITGV